MLVQHAVESPSLILVPVYPVLDVFRSITSEVVCEQWLARISIAIRCTAWIGSEREDADGSSRLVVSALRIDIALLLITCGDETVAKRLV